jgi:hypothetical protein
MKEDKEISPEVTWRQDIDALIANSSVENSDFILGLAKDLAAEAFSGLLSLAQEVPLVGPLAGIMLQFYGRF